MNIVVHHKGAKTTDTRILTFKKLRQIVSPVDGGPVSLSKGEINHYSLDVEPGSRIEIADENGQPISEIQATRVNDNLVLRFPGNPDEASIELELTHYFSECASTQTCPTLVVGGDSDVAYLSSEINDWALNAPPYQSFELTPSGAINKTPALALIESSLDSTALNFVPALFAFGAGGWRYAMRAEVLRQMRAKLAC